MMDQSEERHVKLEGSQNHVGVICGSAEIDKIDLDISAEDPKPQEPRHLTLNGLETQHSTGFKLDAVETVLERLKVATERQIEKTLKKHHEELLSDICQLIGRERRNIPEPVLRSQIEVNNEIPDEPKKNGSQAQARVREGGRKPASRSRSLDRIEGNRLGSQVVGIARAMTCAILNSQISPEDRLDTARSETGDDSFYTRCNSTLNNALHHPVFELAMGILVISNSIFIGWEIEYMTTHPGTIIPPLELTIISYAYTSVFILELTLRLFADWWGFIWNSNANTLAWNYLDILIVGSSIVEVGLDILTYQNASSNDIDFSNLRVIRMVRVFRLIRLLRIARFVRFVRALRMLVFSIVCTLKSVFWAMVLMAVIIYVFAILFTQATVSYNTIESLKPDIPNLELYWGTIGSSMFSLFMSISAGISWIEVIEPLGEIDLSWQFLFLVYIYFTYFAILNVVTGLFCQAAVENCSEDHDSMLQTVLRHKQMYTERFMEIFEEIDADRSGRITKDEFIARMEDGDVKDYFACLELHCADALCLFEVLDDAAENGIRVDEFVMGCLRLKGTARSSDMIRLLHENRLLMEYLTSLLNHFNIASDNRKTHPTDVFMHLTGKEMRTSSSMS